MPVKRSTPGKSGTRALDRQPVASTAKVLSLFEPQTRVVKRGKLGAAVGAVDHFAGLGANAERLPVGPPELVVAVLKFDGLSF